MSATISPNCAVGISRGSLPQMRGGNFSRPNVAPTPRCSLRHSRLVSLTIRSNVAAGARARMAPNANYSPTAGQFTHPCVRPAPASQAREPDSPSGFRSMLPSTRCHIPVTNRAPDVLNALIAASLKSRREALLCSARRRRIATRLSFALSACIALFALAAYFLARNPPAAVLSATIAFIIFITTLVAWENGRTRTAHSLQQMESAEGIVRQLR